MAIKPSANFLIATKKAKDRIFNMLREINCQIFVKQKYILKRRTGVPPMVQNDLWHLVRTGVQVPSLAWHSGLRIQSCRCGLGCIYGSRCDPWPRKSICRGVAKIKNQNQKPSSSFSLQAHSLAGLIHFWDLHHHPLNCSTKKLEFHS